jgi:hypothetical protein
LRHGGNSGLAFFESGLFESGDPECCRLATAGNEMASFTFGVGYFGRIASILRKRKSCTKNRSKSLNAEKLFAVADTLIKVSCLAEIRLCTIYSSFPGVTPVD